MSYNMQRWVAICADGRRVEIEVFQSPTSDTGLWHAEVNGDGFAGHCESLDAVLLLIESNLVGRRQLVTELHPASEPSRSELLASLAKARESLEALIRRAENDADHAKLPSYDAMQLRKYQLAVRDRLREALASMPEVKP